VISAKPQPFYPQHIDLVPIVGGGIYVWEKLYSGTQNWEICRFIWEEAMGAVNNKI